MDVKINQRLVTLSEEERDAMIERCRENHPEWVEDPELALAVLNHLVAEELLDDEKLRQHAIKKQAADLEGVTDYDYESSLDAETKKQLDADLHQAVVEKSRSLDEEQQEELIRKCMKDNPAWNPRYYEHMVVMEAMLDEDAIPEHLQPLAQQKVSEELESEYADFEVEESFEKLAELESELEKLVNVRRSEMSQEDIDLLVETAKVVHPFSAIDDGTDLNEFADMQLEGFATARDSFGSDGTFTSSFASRFGWPDLIWFLLGVITCMTIVYAFGKKEEQSPSPQF